MNEIKCNGLCIRSIDYKEDDKLMTVYAFGKGKITALAKGVKKPKAKLRYASSLLCFGTYYFTERNGFYTLIGCDLIDSFYAVWTNIEMYFPALASLEILEKFAMDNDINDNLGVESLNLFKAICYEDVDSNSAFIKYLINVLKLLGYEIQGNYCANCGAESGRKIYFSPQSGGIVFDCCCDNEEDEIPYSLYKNLQNCLKGKIEGLSILEKKGIITLLYKYLRYVFDANYKAMEQYLRFLM